MAQSVCCTTERKQSTSSTPPVLRVEQLQVIRHARGCSYPIVEGITFDVRPGQTLALVGESGCGKSITAAAILGLLPWGFAIGSGRIQLDGHDVLSLPTGAWRRLRGRRVGAVFQNPLAALNPSLPIWKQVIESIALDEPLTRDVMRRQAIQLLERVEVPEARSRLDDYPHQFSGGMRQRVALALALARNPGLLIADEPTTALDLITQSQILNMLKHLQQEQHLAILFITHDLSLVAEYADEVFVMYAGQEVERGSVPDLFGSAYHPYTHALLGSIPRLTSSQERLSDIEGAPPNPLAYPPGCRFAPRCPRAQDPCRILSPPRLGDIQHEAYCHHPYRTPPT